MRVCASSNGAGERTVRACMPVEACAVTASISQINRGRFIVPKLIVFQMHAFLFFPLSPYFFLFIFIVHVQKNPGTDSQPFFWHSHERL